MTQPWRDLLLVGSGGFVRVGHRGVELVLG
jgi:hypothetical protein